MVVDLDYEAAYVLNVWNTVRACVTEGGELTFVELYPSRIKDCKQIRGQSLFPDVFKEDPHGALKQKDSILE